jgi:pSer/pThr/pTyr-binding forkhead associated (FHA) protein
VSKGRLVCVNSGVFGETSGDVIVELNGPSVSLGRAKTNDTVIEASGVSCNHVEISFKDQGWHIQDVGRSNGILVNKSEVAQVWLTAGDVISIGAVH